MSSISFLHLSYSDRVDDIIYVSVFHICAFLPALGCICIHVCYPAHFDSLRYSKKRFHSLWVSNGHRHVPVSRILGSGAWHSFVGIRARFSKVICHIYNHATYMIIIHKIIWVNSHRLPSLTPYLYNRSLEILEPSPWCDSSIHVVFMPSLSRLIMSC